MPVKKNRIVFSSFCGENYSCNPRAIFEYLYSNYGEKFEYVWLFDYKKNPIIPDDLKQKAKCVQFNSFKSSYYKATSGVWCFNHRNTKYFKKKKNQLYIQTWHGDIGFKAIDKKLYNIGRLSEEYARKCRVDSGMTDILLSGSDWGYKNLREAFFYENGEIAKYGCPRNDVLINRSKDYLYEEIRNKYNLSPTCKICLFAPTFRKTFDVADSFVTNEEKRGAVIKALESRFGGKWVLMVKYHPASIAKNSGYVLADGENLIDVSRHGDVAELLVASDAMISDYSSISFDYALTKKPCWLYFEDFEQYAKNDREIAIDVDQILFEKCFSTESLIKAVTEHSDEKYQENIDKMLLSFGSYEKGFSCEKTAERIISFIQ
ncbi:MAG: CDP-glycerol glycerophosphotransferase family protein [Clostridia bacterium]|nr:CDP-glycerol glycerophosphotransferase family protein [Clostridia bacterium]